MKILLPVFLILIMSLLPITYAAENVTKQDITQLQNEVMNVKNNVNSLGQEIKDDISYVNSSIDLLGQEITDMKESAITIEKKIDILDKNILSAFTFSDIISNMQLITAIVSGAIIALLTMVIGHEISDFRNRKRAKQFLNDDFKEVNERLVILMTNLRTTLQNIVPNSTIIDSLFNHNETPRAFMRNFLVGLLFFRWDVTVSNMNSLKTNEVEIISKLHGYVIKTDEIPQLDISLISDTINSILNSGDTEQRQRILISEALRIDLTARLRHYDSVFHTVHDDLVPIKWMILSDEHFR